MPLNVLVCARSVPDPGSFPVAQASRFPRLDGLTRRLNEYDLFALEEAARLRENSGARVTVAMAGPARVEEQLRRAVALAGDDGCRLDLPEDDDPDPWRTAAALAGFARPRSFDLILCGAMSEDRMRQAVGPMLAEMLALPSASLVVRLGLGHGEAVVERELAGGARERVLLPLPCLLTVQSGINIPRYPSLTNVLRVKKQDLPVLAVPPPESAPAGSLPTWSAPDRGHCEFIAGTPAQAAETIAERIRRSAPVL